MSILGNANYLITASYSDGKKTSSEQVDRYVDNFENLRRTIATTWLKIPHTVKVEKNIVTVTQEGSDVLLAEFKFMPLVEQKLPDHL